jgi:hypothetical protein
MGAPPAGGQPSCVAILRRAADGGAAAPSLLPAGGARMAMSGSWSSEPRAAV